MANSVKIIPKEWQIKKIKDLLDYERPDKYIVKSTIYSDKNIIPVLTANKSFILGYTDENFGIYKNVPVIIFDDFTTDSKYVDFPFKIKSSAIKILKAKSKDVNLKFVYEKMKSVNFPVGNHKRYYISQYQEQEVATPPIKEQNKIAEILSSVNEEIKKVDKEIKKTEELKRGLMDKLLTKGIGHKKFKKVKIGNIPEKWSFLRMKDVCTVRQGLQIAILKRFKDIGENRYKYITLKNIKEGTYEYIESPKESVICKEDDVLMTRTGNTGVVVTGVEGVFHNNFFLVDYNRNIIDKVFLVYYLRSKKIQDIILDRAGTTTIPDLNHGDFYSIPFIMPPKVEQGNISEILISIDSKIEINKQIKNKLAELKRGLMQDLLSGRVRV